MRIVFEPVPEASGNRPDAKMFVEVEDITGASINAGEWKTDSRGYDVLVISTPAMITALSQRLLELDERNALEAILSALTKPRSWQRLTDDERAVLAEYREHRSSVVAGKPVHVLITHDANQHPHVVKCEDIPPIPADVYYRDGNFYDVVTRRGRGDAFYYKWKDRAKEFPNSREAAIERRGDSGTSSSQSDNF